MLYTLPELPAAAQAFLADWEDKDRNVFEFQTSGTTGPARICQLSRQQILHAAASSQATLGWAAGQSVGLVLPATGMGGRMSLVRASVYGMHLVTLALDLGRLSNKPAPPTEHPPYTRYLDHLSLVPSQALALLQHWLDQGMDPGERVGTLLLGGGPEVSDLRKMLERVRAEGRPWRVFLGFGMTETAGHFALRRLFPHPEPSYTPSPGLEISIEFDSDSDQEFSPESSPESQEQPHNPPTGPLIIRGPVTNHEPLRTREIVRLNPLDGTFEWLGRADLTIQSGGHTLLIDELEAQIRQKSGDFPELSWLLSPHWYLAPLQDPVWGEQVALCLPKSLLETLPDGPLRPDTFAPCLPKAAYPRYLVIVPEDSFAIAGKVRRLDSATLALLGPKPLAGGVGFGLGL
ncbi:MAG: AMP-binding protein [Bacteroidia bacterium]|nr:AMP-binding protein [Bacteroidia bacterium]